MDAAPYYNVGENEDMTADQVQAVVDDAKRTRQAYGVASANRGTSTKRGSDAEEDIRERAAAGASSVASTEDGTTLFLNAKGRSLGSVNPDGSFSHDEGETTTQNMYRDADGKLHWDNGKLAGQAPMPNQDDPRIPKGGFAAQKQREIDAKASPSYSWDKAIRQQNDDLVNKRTSAFTAQQNAEREAYANRNRMQSERRIAMGEVFGVALDGLKSPISKNDQRIRTSSDGKTHYLVSSVSDGNLKAFNSRMRENGGKSDYANVMAYAEVVDDGNGGWRMVGKPTLAYRSWKEGNKEAYFRKMSISHYEPMLLDAYKGVGYSDEQAAHATSLATSGYGSVSDGANVVNGMSDKVEIAKINAASREKVAGMNAQSRENITDKNNETRSSIAKEREEGRNYRADLRDDQTWAKLATEQDKADNSFAVQMKKADTYEKRVGLIGQKLKNDYEVAMKRAKTDEERKKAEATYKDRMASVAEGNIDLGWFKAETASYLGEKKLEDQNAQKEADRQFRLQLEEAKRVANSGRTEVAPSRIKEINEELKALEKVKENGTPEARDQAKERIGVLMNEMRGKVEDVEFKKLSRDEFSELARKDPARAREYINKLKMIKNSK